MAWRRRGLRDRVADSWRQAGGGGVLAAVSGGGDSIAMVRLLADARGVLGDDPAPALVVAHLDHARRAESRDDAAFVAAVAAELGLELVSARLDEAEAADLDGDGGLQARAREARRSRLAAWAGERGLPLVALAHTRDDQAETVLLQLLRGAGARGLSGIGERGPGPLWRPLLEAGRDELRGWLEAEGHGWREDESNASGRFLRNRVRHEVLPLLEKLRPGATRTLARAAELLAADEAELAAQAGRVLGAATRPGPGTIALELGALGEVGPAIRARVYAGAIAGLGGRAWEQTGMERIEGLVRRRRGGARVRQGGVEVSVLGGALRFSRVG